MTKLKIRDKLTKKYILDRISQEEIAEKYTKIPVNNFTLSGNSFRSPLRKDKNPTCNYYYNERDKLRLKDWNGSFDGDVFDLAAKLGSDKDINIRTGKGFQLVLHLIARDFRIHKYSDRKEREVFQDYIEKIQKETLPKVIKVVPRHYNIPDKKYWYNKFGIGTDLLKKAKVFPVDRLFLEDDTGYINLKYTYKASDPAYAYYGGKEKGVVIWKIYFPFRKGKKSYSKFICNKSFIQGLKLDVPSRVGIITKSYKDVLCLKTFGISSISLGNETTLISKNSYFKFKSNHDIVMSSLDYDTAGILMSRKLRNIYNVHPIMFTRGRFGQQDFGVKDFSEFLETYGRRKTENLIKYLVDKNQELFDYLDNYNYESLKNIA